MHKPQSTSTKYTYETLLQARAHRTMSYSFINSDLCDPVATKSNFAFKALK